MRLIVWGFIGVGGVAYAVLCKNSSRATGNDEKLRDRKIFKTRFPHSHSNFHGPDIQLPDLHARGGADAAELLFRPDEQVRACLPGPERRARVQAEHVQAALFFHRPEF